MRFATTILLYALALAGCGTQRVVDAGLETVELLEDSMDGNTGIAWRLVADPGNGMKPDVRAAYEAGLRTNAEAHERGVAALRELIEKLGQNTPEELKRRYEALRDQWRDLRREWRK